MNSKTSSVCIRCGKQRIILSSKKELIGTSMVEMVETVCPDPECQAKVSRILNDESDKRAQSEALKTERMSVRKRISLSKQSAA